MIHYILDCLQCFLHEFVLQNITNNTFWYFEHWFNYLKINKNSGFQYEKACYLFIDEAATIVLHRRDTPKHEPYLDDGDAGRQVKLVHEQFTEEDARKYQPISQGG